MKPWVVWRIIQKWEIKNIRAENEELEEFIKTSADRYNAHEEGMPYEGSTLPPMEPCPAEWITAKASSGNRKKYEEELDQRKK